MVLSEAAIFPAQREKIIPQTVADLRQFDLQLIAPGHCTGWRALNAMSTVFGDELVPLAVGKTI